MIENTVRAQYDRLAPIYDRRWNYYITNTLSFLDAWSSVPASATVLDVACGTGEFERLVLTRNPSQAMVGVDISEGMLNLARCKLQAYPHVVFQVASATSLPFADSSFDRVISANSFHYFDKPLGVLAEMQRVLRPGGQLIILDWCKDFWVCQVCDWLLQWIDPAHRHCYTQAELHGFLLNAGFRIEQSTQVKFGLIWGLMAATATCA